MSLKEKVKKLPSHPGVYLMQDSQGSIIYVGKAKNLKKRVQSYFQSSKGRSQKVEKLVKNLKDFDYILTDTEFEALMLECKLIKEIQPNYNKKMKNPLSYTYIVVQMGEKYQTLEMTNSPVENDGNIYFGPFTNKSTVEKAIQGIKESYKINCSNPSKKNTACLNYSLGSCMGICLGGAAVEKYNHILKKMIALLSGTSMEMLDEMKQKMMDAAEKFNFEAAAKYRDYIDAIHILIKKEEVIEFTEANQYIVMIEYLDDQTMKLFFIKGHKVLFKKKYFLEDTPIDQLKWNIMTAILNYYKSNSDLLSIDVNRYEIDEAQIIYSYLKGGHCSYSILPVKWLDQENIDDIDQAITHLLHAKIEFV